MSIKSGKSANSAYQIARSKAKSIRRRDQDKLIREMEGAVYSVKSQITEYDKQREQRRSFKSESSRDFTEILKIPQSQPTSFQRPRLSSFDNHRTNYR